MCWWGAETTGVRVDQVRHHETTKTRSPRVLGFGQGRQLELRREGGEMARRDRKREPSLKKKTLKDSKMKERNKVSLGTLVWARFPRDCELRKVHYCVCGCSKPAHRKKTAKSRQHRRGDSRVFRGWVPLDMSPGATASGCLLVCVVIFSSKITRRQGCARHRQTSEREEGMLELRCFLLFASYIVLMQNEPWVLCAVINAAALALFAWTLLSLANGK